MKGKKQRNKGITLIVLIVTIVVLLILAGITIGAIMGDNSVVGQASDAKILTQLSKLNEAIDLYKVMEQKDSLEDVDNNILINNKILKEYMIEETLRPIAVIEDYKTLGYKEKFGKGYSDIESYEITGDDILYIATLKELKDVCAIDLTDGTLYYLNDGKIYSISGKTDIANAYNRVNANTAEWEFNTTTKTLTKYLGDLTKVRGNQQVGEVIIPNYFEGTRVSGIGSQVFQNNINLTKLTISNGVQTIGDLAFYNCNNLKGDIIIPDSITKIGKSCFNGCISLNGTLKIGKNVEVIDSSAFCNCNNLRGNIIIPDKITSIGNYAFEGCSSLDGKLKIGSKVQIIGSYAFRNCNNLKGDLIIPDSVTKIGNHVFYSCSSLDGIIKIGKGITVIESNAFYNCSSLKGDLIIPDSVTSVGAYAFNGCISLDGVLKIGNSVQTIGDFAFQNCRGLTGDLIIPDSVISLGKYSFGGCSALNGRLELSDNLETIGAAAFRDCSNLKGDLIIPDSVKEMGQEAFRQCSALDGTIKIGSGIETIGIYTFYNCSSLKGDLVIPNTVTSIGTYAIRGCNSVKSIAIPRSVTEIGTYAFFDLADNSIIYLQDASLESLVEGKYTTTKTTVVVDASKFE